LGNPGREYEGHRHNVGFLVADELALRNRGTFRKHKRSRSLVLEGRLSDQRAVLVKPTTYMNDSGQAVAPLCDFYGVSPDRVVAIHDELDLPFGSMRLKFAGGDNGHNGLRSLRQSFGTGDFYRVRFGVGRPPGRLDPAVFVLRNFSPTERRELSSLVSQTTDAVECLVTEGLERAQSQFNT
jgi:PTH1 family peptidyl-tRNA hydrolase